MAKRILSVKTNSWYDFFTHFGIVAVLGSIIILLVFDSYLPSTTNHRETVTVPNLEGMKVDEVKKFLESRDLDFVIKDSSSYSQKHPSFVVLSQTPESGAKVKPYRKIRLTVNPRNPPKVKIPKIIDMPFSEAIRTLRNVHLELGRITYEPHIAENAILKQKFNGKEITIEEIKQGIWVEQGTQIDVLVGDGVGEDKFSVPDLILKPLDEAEFIAKGHNLHLQIFYKYDSNKEIGTVINQMPKPYIGRVKEGVEEGSSQDSRKRTKVRAGEIIDVWVSGNPAAEPEEVEEEEEELTEEEKRKRDSLNRNINERTDEEIKNIIKKRQGNNPPE